MTRCSKCGGSIVALSDGAACDQCDWESDRIPDAAQGAAEPLRTAVEALLPTIRSVDQETTEAIGRVREALAAQPPAAPVEEEGALGYAQRLATTLWDKHWKAGAPEWKPLPDLIGVLTQIDNMTAGISPSSAATGEAWCQPMDNGKHSARKFLLYFEDADRGIAVFDNEAEAREAFTKANTAWNCYLFGAMPLTATEPQTLPNREEIARILWERFAPVHHIGWADETHKAEYLAAADAVLSPLSRPVSGGGHG